MSASATGRKHSMNTIQKITEAQRGRTLSAAHRAAISASQRHRHAKRRFLVAMEALHQELLVTCQESVPMCPPPEIDHLGERDEEDAEEMPRHSSLGFPAPQTTSHSTVSKRVSSISEEHLDNVHREYAMRLKDFRRIQARVKPWIDEFKQQYGRVPAFNDALDTGDSRIIEPFEEYQFAKDSLMVEIPAMRAALSGDTAGGNRGRNVVNSNSSTPALSPADAASRLHSARQYKARTSSVARGAVTDSSDRLKSIRAKIAGSSTGTNTRAKSALMKALEYKQKIDEAPTRKFDKTRSSRQEEHTEYKTESVENAAVRLFS